MVGDGSYLMMSQEIITSVQEKRKLTIVLLDNGGFASIGGLSESIGSQRFGTRYKYRQDDTSHLDGEDLPVDLASNAESLGAHVIRCTNLDSVKDALREAKSVDRTTVIYVRTDLFDNVEGYGWWEVPVAEVSELDTTSAAYKTYMKNKRKQRYYF
jgi:3D-(3,5/4)-trihydroxycyclohexane-1,2-dione acylhydrolase (decyclizing)